MGSVQERGFKHILGFDSISDETHFESMRQFLDSKAKNKTDISRDQIDDSWPYGRALAQEMDSIEEKTDWEEEECDWRNISWYQISDQRISENQAVSYLKDCLGYNSYSILPDMGSKENLEDSSEDYLNIFTVNYGTHALILGDKEATDRAKMYYDNKKRVGRVKETIGRNISESDIL